MTLPDCMMPDGAEPCKGYAEMKASVEKAERKVERLTAERDAEASTVEDFRRKWEKMRTRAEQAERERDDWRQRWESLAAASLLAGAMRFGKEEGE